MTGLMWVLRAGALALLAQNAAAQDSCIPAYKAIVKYLGCYTDGTPRTLTGPMLTTSANSVENCANNCGQLGYKYSGVEYGRECYCGNAISSPGAPADASGCNKACNGNSSETCGGTYFINIYEITNPSTFTGICSRAPLCSNPVCDASLSAHERAAGLVANLTLAEKAANMMNGAPGVPRLSLPPYEWWNEALHGVASSPGVSFAVPNGSDFSFATSFPMPILVGAAFDDDLVNQIATVVGTEARAFANNAHAGFDFWTPNINAFRDPRWGRGMEVAGEDPFHLENYVYNLVTGLQGGLNPEVKTVIATCKHFAVYDVEESRSGDDLDPTPQELAEFYLRPFKTCARDANVGGIMCSYNAEYGIPSCANRYLLQTVLREHWNWSAPWNWVTSDCQAISDISGDHAYVSSTAAAAGVSVNAGTDLACESSIYSNLVQAVAQNITTEAQIDVSLTRLYASLVQVGYFNPPANLAALGWSDVSTSHAQSLAYMAAAEGITLLKNNGILPLPKTISNVAVIGPWANATTQMQGNYEGTAPYLISPLAAFQEAWTNVKYVGGVSINSANTGGFAAALAAAKAADYIIFLGGIDPTVEAESRDRSTITWSATQLSLISQVADLGKPLVVVQFGGGQVDDSALLSKPGVNALVWAGYPGQSGGRAVRDVLTAVYPVAGRLPVTQYPADYINHVNKWDPGLRPSAKTGNPGRTYMWYPDAVLPMGYGLHYTTFNVGFVCKPRASIAIADLFAKASGAAVPGRVTALTANVNIKNTGNLTSDYVALLFASTTNAGPAPYPIKTLVSYARAKAVAAGGAATRLKLAISLASLARADEDGNFWIYPGDYSLTLDHNAVATANFSLTGTATLLEKAPILPQNPTAISYLGCFSGAGSSLLAGPSFSLGNANYPQACSDKCHASGYSFSGVQASQCFCGSSFSRSPTSATACNTPCSAEALETCGGQSAATPEVKPQGPTFTG